MTRKIALWFVMAVCCPVLYGQNYHDIPALLNQLKKNNPDTVTADIYAKLCYRYCNAYPDSAIWYGNKAMQLSKKIRYRKGIADSYNNLGWVNYTKGDLAKAKLLIDTALAIFKQTGVKQHIAVPLANLATIYVDESNYAQGLTYYAEAYKYLQEAGEKTKAAEMLFSMGRIYNLEKNPAKAREYFQQAYDIHEKEDNKVYMAQALSSVANTYQAQGNYDTAISLYNEVLPVFFSYKDLYRLGNTYENIAIAYRRKKQYGKALFNMQNAKTYYQQLNSKIDLAYVLEGLGEIYKEAGNLQQSVLNYKTALALASQTPEKNLEQSILAGLSEAYMQMRDFENAYLLLDRSYKIKDSLFTRESQNELLKLQTEFETEKKEKENELLLTQNLTASLKLTRNRLWLTATASALLIAGIFLFALYKNRQSKIKNIQRLKELNVQLEEQKKEISRINTILELKALRAQMNPHFIFNCMSSIQECMLTGRTEDANTYLTKLSRLLRMVLNYSDEESIPLDKELQMLNLYLQLEKIRLKNNFNYKIEIEEDIVPEELLVPTLFLQPFAENAIWHGLVNKSNNRLLMITGSIQQDALHFSITDNGVGREKAKALRRENALYQSKGIKLTEKRIAITNSNVFTNNGLAIRDLYNIHHEPAGTCVEIDLPLIVI